MQSSADRLLTALERGERAANYFLHGAEPLQITELGDAIRRRLAEDGVSERLVFDIENASDWDTLAGESQAMSLFAERRLLDIRLGTRKPDKAGGAALAALLERDGDADTVLVTAGKLDGNTRKARWFKQLEQQAVTVATRDPAARELPRWLGRRAARHGKQLGDDAAALIADRVEGNLLAAAQEIEKLCLLVDGDTIDARDVVAAVADSARFDVFQLTDAVLAADRRRALRMIRGLREEGTEPVVVNWALGRELHQLAQVDSAMRRGADLGAACAGAGVWRSRSSLVERALSRLGGDELLHLVAYANRIDTVIKGGRDGAPWDELEFLVLRMCRSGGRRNPPA